LETLSLGRTLLPKRCDGLWVMPRFDPDSAIDREAEARIAEKVARRERISKNLNMNKETQ